MVRAVRPMSETPDPSWSENAACIPYSPVFGFGLMDVEALVRMAKRWPKEMQKTKGRGAGEGLRFLENRL